jgi:hypothetical protein
MTEKPTVESAEPESPPHGPQSTPPPAADGALSAWTARVTANPPAVTTRRRPRWKKILVPVVLAVIGLALLLAGFLIYPRRAGFPAPVSDFVNISSKSSYVNAHMGLIYYTVDQVHPDVARVTIDVQMGSHVPRGPRLSIQLDVLGAATVTHCSPSCSEVDVAPAVLDTEPYFQYGTATAYFSLKARSLEVAANGATAEVAFPGLYFTGTKPASLILSYDIPSGNSYDWSPNPPDFFSGSSAAWYDNVALGHETPSLVATGINHTAQTHDSTLTLVVGILFGIAGGALVAAVQEALHD